MAFSFLQRGNLADHARQCTLTQYKPQLVLQGLVQGVDNLRHDVFLSPRFREVMRAHLAHMIAKYGTVEDLAELKELATPKSSTPPSIMRPSPFLTPGGSSKPGAPGTPAPAKAADPGDFKSLLVELHTVSLNRAKQDNNQSLDMVARIAVLLCLRNDLLSQFGFVLDRCRAKAQSYEGSRHTNNAKAIEAR